MNSEELAAKGAKWMDADPNWYKEIDENTLNMGSAFPKGGCVLCQYTQKSWWNAIYELGISEKFAEEYGFEIPKHNFDVSYDCLTEAWRNEILDRKLGKDWTE